MTQKEEFKWNRKDLLGLEDLNSEEIEHILITAKSFQEILERPIRKVPTLRGKTIVNLFLEPSTRTSTSFDIAAKRLSADTVNISAKSSSILKGETLLDMARNLEAMKIDVLIVRHSASGAPHFLAKRLRSSVVNAGDGWHEHPSQGLLDIFTIKEKYKRLSGLNVLIVGDIAHSRVARSNIFGLLKMGAKITICAPPTLLPWGIENLGVSVSYNLDEAIKKADIIMVLRLQIERQTQNLFPSLREYARLFGITRERMKKAKKNVLIMHPGPINRGIEIEAEVADGPWSVILEQVTSGVSVRMAILYLLSGGEIEAKE